MARPDDLLWAKQQRYDPVTGFTNKVEPIEQLKDSGLKLTHNVDLKHEGLGDGWLNYLLDLTGDWYANLDEANQINTVRRFSSDMPVSTIGDLFGGTWTQIGTKVVNLETMYYYKRDS